MKAKALEMDKQLQEQQETVETGLSELAEDLLKNIGGAGGPDFMCW